jgi:hypothetical protein
MKQLYKFGGNFSPFLVKKNGQISSFQSFRPPRYSWNTAESGVKPHSINQSILQWYIPIKSMVVTPPPPVVPNYQCKNALKISFGNPEGCSSIILMLLCRDEICSSLLVPYRRKPKGTLVLGSVHPSPSH